jgi:phosphoglycerate kinase
MPVRTLQDIGDIKGKKILVRCDFNVPVKDGVVQDGFRIRQTMPTLTFLQGKGARLILVSHIEGGSNTLRPVYEYLQKTLQLGFCQDCLEDSTMIAGMKDGDIVLCENIRLYDGEKTNDQEFAKQLAALADLYVNDAFSVSHRNHASVVGVPKYLPGFAGIRFEDECQHLAECLKPPHPFLFIIGGAKFDTKVPLIQKFLTIADQVFVGGALAHNFFRAEGIPIGRSLISEGDFGEKKMLEDKKLLLPCDVVVKTDSGGTTKSLSGILPDDVIVDNGEGTVEMVRDAIVSAQFVLWNGPFGSYENGYKAATLEIAKAIAASGKKSVVGGGDTLAAIAELNIEDKFGFVSGAGGAMLDFLLDGTLPGIEALKKSR